MEKINDLKLLREKVGYLTQLQMANLLNMSYNNYINYERERYKSMSKDLEEYISKKTGYNFTYAPNELIEKEDIPDYCKTLKQLREERGITQFEMAQMLGTSYNNYVNYDRELYEKMSPMMEKKISRILGIEYHYKRS